MCVCVRDDVCVVLIESVFVRKRVSMREYSEDNTGPGNDGKRGSPSPQVYIVILWQCVFVCRSVCVGVWVVCVCVCTKGQPVASGLCRNCFVSAKLCYCNTVCLLAFIHVSCCVSWRALGSAVSQMCVH